MSEGLDPGVSVARWVLLGRTEEIFTNASGVLTLGLHLPCYRAQFIYVLELSQPTAFSS